MSCEKRVIAQCDFGCVDVCACGNVAVHVGNASVRLPKQAFLGFCRMMDEAFAVVADQEAGVHENEWESREDSN